MTRGDHKTNDAYIDDALWRDPSQAILIGMLPKESVYLEESGDGREDFVLMSDGGEIILRFPQNGTFANGLRKKGAILHILASWGYCKKFGAWIDPAQEIRYKIDAMGEILEIAADFDLDLKEILKDVP